MQIEIIEPLVIHGDLYGHMANAEEINSLEFQMTSKLSASVKHLTSSGIAPPSKAVSIVFQSGSRLDVACQDIRTSFGTALT